MSGKMLAVKPGSALDKETIELKALAVKPGATL